MAIQIQGNSGTVGEIDNTTFRATRVTSRPISYLALGSYKIAQISGTMAAALGASSEIYQFRWTNATNLAVVHSVKISASQLVAASTAQLLGFQLDIARAFTAAGTGGTAATITGNNQKLRTSMGTTLLGESRIASTAALGAGTKTLDAQSIGNTVFSLLTGAITTVPAAQMLPRTTLISSEGIEHPIILATNEGFVIRTGVNAFPAAATWQFSVEVAWTETVAY